MIRQIALRREKGPAFLNSFGPSVASRWSQTPQVGQAIRKADESLQEHRISFSCKINDSHPCDSPFHQPGRVQIHL